MRSPIIAPISNVTTVFLLHLRLWSCFDDIVAGLVLLQRGMMEGTGTSVSFLITKRSSIVHDNLIGQLLISNNIK